ncbi:hypothetical protein QE152_g4459 [Popillia japonica]|uniref:Uncharacterized protein n=1 Tax=Popillia japonica TaxID=7064 RepID=A0AAW1N2C0_POPJA
MNYSVKFATFHNNIVDAYEIAFPIKTVNEKVDDVSWFCEELRNRRSILELLNDMYRVYRTDHLGALVKDYKRENNRMIRNCIVLIIWEHW